MMIMIVGYNPYIKRTELIITETMTVGHPLTDMCTSVLLVISPSALPLDRCTSHETRENACDAKTGVNKLVTYFHIGLEHELCRPCTTHPVEQEKPRYAQDPMVCRSEGSSSCIDGDSWTKTP